MATFFVGYDLEKKPGSDYTELEDTIKKIGAWWHCLDSTWFVECSYSAVQIRDFLNPHLRANDKLLVVECKRPSGAWIGFDQDCSSWLKNHLS